MDNFEIERILKTITLIVDTREKPNERYYKRIEDTGLDYIPRALLFADYACEIMIGDEYVSLENVFAIERKMNLDELCMCFGKDRKRFKAEFERAKSAGCKIYLIVENCTFEHILNGKYRSKYNKESLLASLLAWIPRYNIIPIFCKEESTGRIIKEIMYRETKELLMSGGGDTDNSISSSDRLHK